MDGSLARKSKKGQGDSALRSNNRQTEICGCFNRQFASPTGIFRADVVAIGTAIADIPEDAWQPIEYPQAVWDDQLGYWISDAEISETQYTAFTSKKKALHVTARLIVRRVRDKAKGAPGQGELFPRLAVPPWPRDLSDGH